MQYTISPREMKRIEQRFMAESGTSGLELMERAAAHGSRRRDAASLARAKLLVLAGTGNNGGDGLAAARLLLTRFETLQCEIIQLSGKLSPEAAEQTRRLETFSRTGPCPGGGRRHPADTGGLRLRDRRAVRHGLSRALSGAALESYII